MLFQRRYYRIVTIFFFLSMSLFLVSCLSLPKSISNSNISERRFYAFPNLDAIEIVSWTPGAELQISVYIDKNVYDAGGKARFSTAYIVLEEGEGWIFDIPIDPQNYIVLIGGDISRQLIVQNVGLTEINAKAEQVFGYAPANANVWVEAWNEHGVFQEIKIIVQHDGTWVADFTGLVDVTYQSGAAIHLYDNDGDASSDERTDFE